MARTNRPNGFLRLVAAILVLAGLGMALPGIYLLTLGGSAYYLVGGIVMALSGVLVWRGHVAGPLLYILLFVGTVCWALWESGLNGWALLPRLNIVTVLGVLLLVALARPTLGGWLRIIGAVVVLAAIFVGAVFMWPRTHGGSNGTIAAITPSADEADWPVIGRTAASERYSPLAQITPDNVGRLEVAWKVHLGAPPEGMVGSVEATPLKINDTLYLCNMHNEVLALDAETGREKWRFDPQMERLGVVMAMCRGVTYVEAPPEPGATAGACTARIVLTTHDARMIALDARNGRKCPGFGVDGEIDLRQGMGEVAKGYYYMTSPALLVRDVLVVGGSVLDGQEIEEPSGVIRGFDAVTGEFRWAWDMGRPGETGMPGEGERFTPGTPNAWAPLTGDEELGLVYAPLGNATPDYLTEHRTPEMNEFASSVVAIDVTTGELRWSFQTVHLDVWDYDLASPPTLVDFPTGQGLRKALIQPTKRGEFFVLDRLTGEPLVDVEERPVPQGTVPTEVLSPTQPYSAMPSFRGPKLTEARMWGATPFDHLWCRIRFRQARYEGDFTPITTDWTVVYPGYFGGSNWYGVSVDPERQLMLLNVNYFPMFNRLVPREEADPAVYRPFIAGEKHLDIAHWPQQGTRYATKTGPFVSPLGAPCHQPPYSEVAAVDLNSREVVWQKPLGTARDSKMFGVPFTLPIRMGVPALGGTMVTKSGLMFIAATQERSFRAFDVKSGKMLWEDRLPASGNANPMSYYSERSGRQFVVIPATGYPQFLNKAGDYLVAYALPKQQ